jgi:DNA-directed RNA polymerase, beta subunit/140 kD subunit
MSEVYINSKLVGEVENPKEFAAQLRDQRRKGTLPSNTNVYYDPATTDVHVLTEKGRARRPVIVVKDGQPALTEEHVEKVGKKEMSFVDLINEGIIEYIDAAEEENCLIAFKKEELTPEHTHMEITPMAMLGLCASLVPYGNFNQSTRLNAGAKNQKQAVGQYASNFPVRLDMDVNIMHYPQKPLSS